MVSFFVSVQLVSNLDSFLVSTNFSFVIFLVILVSIGASHVEPYNVCLLG
jgi:hypothetical protein